MRAALLAALFLLPLCALAVAPALYVPLASPSVMILFAIASGEWKGVADAERLRFGSVGMPHTLAWTEVASAAQEGNRIRIVTRDKHVHELYSRPLGKGLWREFAARLGLEADEAPRETTRAGLR